MKNLKIGIVGHGFVGKAVDYGFAVNTEKKIIDPLYSTQIIDLKEFDPEVIFICVPTPMSDDGDIDCSVVFKVIEEITANEIKGLIIIKSSITPSKLQQCKKINTNCVYNPEFLTEKNANFDFINPSMLIIGGSETNCSYVEHIYDVHSSCNKCPVYHTDIYTASLVKYTLNAFLATKVLFMNEIYQIFSKTNTSNSWNEFIKILATDPRIGKSHMQVPGPDGKYGFGGACFPKDISAIISYASEKEQKLELIDSVRKINNKIRSTYSSIDLREKEQNVKFHD